MSNIFRVSVVIPILNEVDSIIPLLDRLLLVLQDLGTHEVIFVNDGSTDGSEESLNNIYDEYEAVKVLHLKTNWGKSIALQTGFNEASGEYVVMMDADLQDRPEEIPKLLNCLNENGLDVVTGWRVDRKDIISKRLTSLIFNKVLRYFSGLRIHDFNCGLKVMRNECLNKLRIYGQLHRFILVLLSYEGMRVGELAIEHSPRKFGKSKYGAKRLYAGCLDFITVIFLTRYFQSPLYMFGLYSIWCFGLGCSIPIYFLINYFFFAGLSGGILEQNTLWIFSLVFFLAALIFICFGLIGELVFHLLSKHENKNFVKKNGFKC